MLEARSLVCPSPDLWTSDRCPHCGSISLELFLKYLGEGAEIIRTDKPWKWYIKTDKKMMKFYSAHL